MTKTAQQASTGTDAIAVVRRFPDDPRFADYRAAAGMLEELREGLREVETRIRGNADAGDVAQTAVSARVDALLAGKGTPGAIDEVDTRRVEDRQGEIRRLYAEKLAIEQAIRRQEAAVSVCRQKAAAVVADAIRPEWRELGKKIHNALLQLEESLVCEAELHRQAAAVGLPLAAHLPRLTMSVAGAAYAWRCNAREAGILDMTTSEFWSFMDQKERQHLDAFNTY